MFPGVGLQDGGVAVPGLPHDCVRIGALPERFGDEPGPQRMPTQFRDLFWGVSGVGGAAGQHHVHRLPRHPDDRDPAGLVDQREQRPPRIDRFGEVDAADVPVHSPIGCLPAELGHHRPSLSRRVDLVGGVQ